MQYGPYRAFELRSGKGIVLGTTLVSAPDVEVLSWWRWVPDKDGYVVSDAYVLGSGKDNPRKHTYRMHRIVLRLGLSIRDDPRQGDHINGNRLDNRRENLRIVTHAEQAQNRHHFHRGKSRFRGVHWHPHANLWGTRIHVDKKPRSVGYYKNEIDAAVAVHRARLEHMPFAEPDPFLVELGLADGHPCKSPESGSHGLGQDQLVRGS